jgi:Phage-related protein
MRIRSVGFLRLGPNSINTRFDFFQTMILHLHTFGNFFAKIDRNNLTGQASRLTIMEPQKVRMEYNNRNEVVYVYTSRKGAKPACWQIV